MHANTWILDHLLITYVPICKFVAGVAYFVDLGGGGSTFLFPGIFFTSPVINHESSSGKRRKHSPWPQHVSSVTTPLHKGRFSGAANLRAALNHSFVKMFPLKTKVFPPLFFSVLSVCDLFFPHSFTERGPYPKAECRNEREAEQRSGRNHFVPPSLLC